MNSQSYLPCLAALVLLDGSPASGQSTPDPWRVGVGYRALFNMEVSFANRDPGPASITPAGVDQSYADGYIGTDSTGNSGNLTTYWGYKQGAQWAGDNLAFRNSRSGALGADDDLWANGMELVVGRQLGQGNSVRWGLEGGFGYSQLDASWSGPAATGVLSLHSYALGGITPPLAPYAGPQAAGPGVPLLAATPVAVPFQVAADLEADFFGLRLGPYFEFPASQRCSVILGCGVSVAVVDSEVRFQETAAPPYAAVGLTQASSETDAVLGAYLLGQVNVDLGRGWGAFSAVQFHTLNSCKQSVADKVAKLDLNSTLAWMLGVQYRF